MLIDVSVNIFDEAEGWPDDGVPPQTRWSDVSYEWVCLDGGAKNPDFDRAHLEV